MTIEEAKKALEELKQEGNSEEDLLKMLYIIYTDGKIRLSDLRTFVGLLGYEFTDEFEAMSEEDKKKHGFKKTDEPAEGVDKEDIEEAKEYGDDEGEEKEEEDKPESEPKADDDGEEEDDDEKKAARLFGFGNSNK